MLAHRLALMTAFAAPADPAAAPEWVHLLPAGAAGRIDTLDSRGPYRLAEAAAVIAASLQGADRLPIDENHATDLAAPRGEPAPARGWIVAMEARSDGIWGRVEWTAEGQRLVADRAYRGISPVVAHDAAKRVHAILRASLVNRPNLLGLTALHQQQDPDMDMERLAQALGLAAGASLDAMITAAEGLKAPSQTALQAQLAQIGVVLGTPADADAAAILAAATAAKGGTGPVVTALQAEIASLTTQLNGVVQGQARARAEAFVDAEIKRGRVGVKPLRDHYVARHMADAASVETEISALPVLQGGAIAAVTPPPKEGGIALNAAEMAAARALSIDPKTYAETLRAERLQQEAL